MALTPLQRDVCRLLADSRIASGESYVAGGAILEHAARSAHYSSAELSGLAFEGEAPEGAALGARWRSQMEEARDVIGRLPPEETGRCVLGPGDALYKRGPAALRDDLAAGRLVFHSGRIRGAFPTLRG
jgi:hypothetical protein